MFEKLPTVPNSQDLIDKAFRRASKYAKNDKSAVTVAGNILANDLANLVRKFPSFENLPPFYREIVEIIIGVDAMRIKLSRLQWASQQIQKITKASLRNMKRSDDSASYKRAALGRMSSVIKSIAKDLEFLDESREKLRWIPTLDIELPTILVAGFPNVGKSSFISQITNAKPKIASYPFTTKTIQIGHFKRGHQTYQVVDTPGLLDRPFEDRNLNERQAIAALRHLKGAVIFIIDPSGHSGYALEPQLHLAEEIKNWIDLPILLVSNKSDLAPSKGILGMSSLTGEGIFEVVDLIATLLNY